jgi:hypothetical protein
MVSGVYLNKPSYLMFLMLSMYIQAYSLSFLPPGGVNKFIYLFIYLFIYNQVSILYLNTY